MTPRVEMARAVRERAGDRCQYCLMHQSLQGAAFHMEHINPRSKGGETRVANLTLACPSCNLHKADRTDAIDPSTSARVPLFHPLQQVWSEHFRFRVYEIEGLTPVGRATVAALNFNHARRQRIRVAEQKFGLYPFDSR